MPLVVFTEATAKINDSEAALSLTQKMDGATIVLTVAILPVLFWVVVYRLKLVAC
jgi:hypothetical protein